MAQKANDQEAEGSICYKIGLLYFKYGDFNKTIDFQNKYLLISTNNIVKEILRYIFRFVIDFSRTENKAKWKHILHWQNVI